MDGAKIADERTTRGRMVDELEQAARKMAAGQANACGEERVVALRRSTVRDELQQQIQYHCNEIRRLLDLKDRTPHAILESPAGDMHMLVKAING